jgi:P pilus assembly chaperone PapD
MISRKSLSQMMMAILLGAATLTALPAQANLALTPTLVLIEGRQRYADLNIINVTNARQAYEISWKHLEMQEGTGSYKPSDKSVTDFDLTQNITFTPRRVVIPPKGAQRVRFNVRLQGEMPPAGDYRAHVSLMNRAVRSNGDDVNPGEIRPSVTMNTGFSIPVIYRVGGGDGGSATIGEISTQINPKTNRIEAVVPITRNEGPYSVLAALNIYYDGKIVGQVGNANMFPEIKGRVFNVPLNVQQLSGGTLEVVLKHYDKNNKTVFARKSVSIAR